MKGASLFAWLERPTTSARVAGRSAVVVARAGAGPASIAVAMRLD